MSDHIPFEIQEEIMNMLPVKSLLRFQSVCKAWSSLIESSDFITHYRSQQQHLLVSSLDRDDQKYVSIVDDDTFPQHKASLTFPVSVKEMLKYDPSIISSCHGLVCFYCDSTRKAVIWNISLRKTVTVVVPTCGGYYIALGFGVCRETSDPKIVNIRYNDMWSQDNVTCIPSQVEVFTLSTGAWRSPYGSKLPRKSIYFYRYDKVVIDGVFYWRATNTINDNYNLIISFDMTSEEFREITFPEGIAHDDYCSLSYLGNSLVVGGHDKQVINNKDLCVWMMEGGVSNSFTKLFTITSNGNVILRGFRKNGEPIIGIRGKVVLGGERLAVYKPDSERIDYLGINGFFSVEVYPYMETLFLLDQPDNMLYSFKALLKALSRANHQPDNMLAWD